MRGTASGNPAGYRAGRSRGAAMTRTHLRAAACQARESCACNPIEPLLSAAGMTVTVAREAKGQCRGSRSNGGALQLMTTTTGKGGKLPLCQRNYQVTRNSGANRRVLREGAHAGGDHCLAGQHEAWSLHWPCQWPKCTWCEGACVELHAEPRACQWGVQCAHARCQAPAAC